MKIFQSNKSKITCTYCGAAGLGNSRVCTSCGATFTEEQYQELVKRNNASRRMILIWMAAVTAVAVIAVGLVMAIYISRNDGDSDTGLNQAQFAGTWGGGSVITIEGDTLHITMGTRPSATGKFVPNKKQPTASVTFPDNGILTARLVDPNRIEWTDGSYWLRVNPAIAPQPNEAKDGSD